MPLGDTNNAQVHEITVPSITENDLRVENQHATVLHQLELGDDIQVLSAVDANQAVIDTDINNIIEDVIKLCKENSVTSTKEVIISNIMK